MIHKNPNWVRGVTIGKGSFGTVSLAVDKSTGRQFAVKSVAETPGRFSESLENEIRILKSLSSPYIIRYLGDDLTSSENSPTTAAYRNLHMEYMPGGTAADIAEHGETPAVRSYARCVAAALSYIHRRNIVHCDVKGRNVLIGENSGAAKLADFGSAAETGRVPVTGTRGSPLWMAPEVVRGEYQGPESDVWSLGCTVIEMVTGKPAWQDAGIDTLFRIGFSNELPDFPAHFSDKLRDFLDKCLKRNPSERWSCDQLLQHPFLLLVGSTAVEPTNKKWSPRCVFDFSNFSSDEESSSDEEIKNSNSDLNLNLNSSSSDARQRMGILSCNSGLAKWESDGWEVVRNAADDGGPAVTSWPENEYSDDDGYDDDHDDGDDDDGGENIYAHGTSDGWLLRDMDNNYYSCCVYVLITKSLLLFNRNAIRHIYLFLFNFIPNFHLLLLHYVGINYLPIMYLLFICKGFYFMICVCVSFLLNFAFKSILFVNNTIRYIRLFEFT